MNMCLVELNGTRWFSFGDKQLIKVGRDEESVDFFIDDDSVSSIHAQLSTQGDKWFVEDLGSLENTFLNGKALEAGEKVVITDGSNLTFGFAEFILIHRAPVDLVPDDKLPKLPDISVDKWQDLSLSLRALCLLDQVSELLEHTLDTESFVEAFLDVIKTIFDVEVSVLALEDQLHLRGLEKNDAFAESILRKARFQMKALAFSSTLHPEQGKFVAFYAPIFLEDLARGYLYILAPEDSTWSDEEFVLFAYLAKFASRGVTSFQALRRAQEDREVLHLNLVGIAPAMQALKIDLLRVARQKEPVLVTGEDGVGKSRIARAVHQASERRQAPLMVLNAASFPKEIFEAAIFGTVEENDEGKSVEKIGRVTLAEGGSFLIEEIGELPLGVQPSLLALIKSQSYIPIGAGEPSTTDVRILATSSLELNELEVQGKIIPELAEIFKGSSLVVPPLRNRKEDVPQLFRAFLGRFGEEEGLPTCVVSDDALSLLKNHRWNQNIRELRKVVSRCFYELDPDRPIVSEELIRRVLAECVEEENMPARPGKLQMEVMKVEHRVIQEALMAANDDVVEAAKELGLSLVVLRRKMRALGIG